MHIYTKFLNLVGGNVATNLLHDKIQYNLTTILLPFLATIHTNIYHVLTNLLNLS